MQRDHEWDAKQMLAQLQEQLQSHYHPQELHARLTEVLTELKGALAGSSEDARLVVQTYHQMLRREAGPEAVAHANQALSRLLKELGLAVVGLLPFAFITLPAIYALARHFRIELVPEKDEKATD